MSGMIPRATVLLALEFSDDPAPADLPDELALETVGAGYIAYLRVSRTLGPDDSHPDYWTWLVVHHLVQREPDVCLDLLCAAVAQCRDVQELSHLAAGHLEDLIAQRGDEVIARIEALARENPRFRLALTGVWPQGNRETEVWRRIEAARQGDDTVDTTTELPPVDRPMQS